MLSASLHVGAILSLNAWVHYSSNKTIVTKPNHKLKIMVRTKIIQKTQTPIKVMPEVVPKPIESKKIVTTKVKKIISKPVVEVRTEPRPIVEAHQQKTVESDSVPSDNKLLMSQEGVVTSQKYVNRLKVFLEQNKHYPKMAKKLKHSGIVKVKVQINRDGTFGTVLIEEPSRYGTLNTAAINLLNKLGRFEPPPNMNGESEDFVIPISYVLKRRI